MKKLIYLPYVILGFIIVWNVWIYLQSKQYWGAAAQAFMGFSVIYAVYSYNRSERAFKRLMKRYDTNITELLQLRMKFGGETPGKDEDKH